MNKEQAKVGARFKAYGRTFTIKHLSPSGVYTERDDGERGFFSWTDLANHARAES